MRRRRLQPLRCIKLYSTLAAFALLLFTSSASATRYTPTQLGDKRETELLIGGPGWTARRLLSGPGSSPPRCRSKCGRCSPCKAVHVAIQPGLTMPLEYYPEAWRCKCGNKLFMP